MEKPKFRQYSFLGETRTDYSLPLVGSISIDRDFPGSDANFYPNHEVFGTCFKGEYPIYGKFEIVRDQNTGKPTHAYCQHLIAHVPGESYDGKEEFLHPVFMYPFDVAKYVCEDGCEMRGAIARITLNEPFMVEGKSVVGYDLAWLGR